MERLTLLVAAGTTVAGSTASAQAPERRPLSLEEALQLARPASEDRARPARRRPGPRPALAEPPAAAAPGGSIGYTHQLKSQFDGVFGNAVDSTAPAADHELPTGPQSGPEPADRRSDRRARAGRRLLDPAQSLRGLQPAAVRPEEHLHTGPLRQPDPVRRRPGVRQIKAANAERNSAAIGLTSAEAAVVLEVVEAYYDAALTDRLVAIAEATLTQTDTTLRQTQLRRGESGPSRSSTCFRPESPATTSAGGDTHAARDPPASASASCSICRRMPTWN
ncbi:MAG: hypothetical protein R2882_14710 [Gemmatimonadales bacterium]